MRSILKYPLDLQTGTVDLPKGAIIRKIGGQPQDPPDILEIWAEVDLDSKFGEGQAPAVIRHRYHVFGTGHTIPGGLGITEFAGTVEHHGFVWHLFGPKPE